LLAARGERLTDPGRDISAAKLLGALDMLRLEAHKIGLANRRPAAWAFRFAFLLRFTHIVY
jgi:hypothetical protein